MTYQQQLLENLLMQMTWQSCTLQWQTLEDTLNQDMATLSTYLQNWKLKLSITKTVTTAFHLYSKVSQRELNIAVEGRTLPFCS